MLNDLRDTYGFRIPEIFPAYSAEAQAIFDAMPTEPNSARKTLINNLVVGLKDDGIWAKLDILYLTAAHAQDSSLLNWINPGTHDCTVVNLLAANYIIDRGWTGNGVNGYLRCNYNPGTDAVYYALNSASGGVYIRTNVVEDMFDYGIFDAIQWIALVSAWTDGNAYHRINDATADAGANADSRGFYVMSRTGAAVKITYKNGAVLINDVTASMAVPNEAQGIFILNYNDNSVPGVGRFSTKQISAAFAGGGMIQANVDDFTDRIETFMDAIGAGIIP